VVWGRRFCSEDANGFGFGNNDGLGPTEVLLGELIFSFNC
jgi:hypothetical protein